MAIVIQIQLDEQGNIQGIERLNKTLRDTGKVSKETTREMSGLDSALDRAAKKYLSFAVAYQQTRNMAGLAKNLTIEFTKTAMQFESMKVTLDTLTKGQGAEWFGKLNAWALKMPITTQGAVQGFIRLRAMGLQPTIEQMTILTDATAALGGQSDTFDGLVLAMGQIQSKGQLMSQELRQLAERGIPAYEILQQKLGITAAELEKTNHAAIRADVALKALFEGMAERYGGLSTKIMYETGTGIKEQLIGNWTEFQRVMMDAGPYDFVKARLQNLANIVGKLAYYQRVNNQISDVKDYMEKMGVPKRYSGAPNIEMSPTEAAQQPEGFRPDYSAADIIKWGVIKKQSEAALKYKQDVMESLTTQAERLSPNRFVEDEEKKTKVSYKYQEEELKRRTEREKRLSGVTTQSQEQRLNSSRAYLEQVLTETGYYADRKIEVDMQYWDELQKLQQEGKMMQISLQFKGMEREKELLKAEYDAKIAQYEEGDARIAELRRNLESELELIDKEGLLKAENAAAQFAQSWGSMWIQAQNQSGNAVQNIIADLRQMGEQLAVMSVLAGAFGAASGIGFLGGVTGFLKTTPLKFLFGAGKSSGGYTGNQMGLYHPFEYVSNKKTVDYYGVGFFDNLARNARAGGNTTTNSSYAVNINFSAAEKAAMANESDTALAQRISRLIDERKIKVPA